MNKTTTTTTITKSSQITLPAKAQRALGVRPGDRVRVTIKEGSVELTVPRFPSIASLTGAAGNWSSRCPSGACEKLRSMIGSPPRRRGMTKAFVDTDVIIRLLTGDDLAKQRAAVRLFQSVEQGTLRLHAPDTVIADAVYVLASPRLYNAPRADVRDMLSTLVRLPQFAVDNKSAVLRAIDVYADSTLDFGDALIVATTEGADDSTLYSFDHDFSDYAIDRLEPAA